MRGATNPETNPFTIEGRLADMDAEGIARSVNYPTALLMNNQLEPVLANELAHAYNAWTYEAFTVPSNGRVLSMGLVHVGDPTTAVVEARRAVTEFGAAGIVISPFAGQLHLDDPQLDPLWAVAEELDVAVGVHGGRFTTEPLLSPSAFRDSRRYYVLAHPFGQMIALADMVMGGVFDRFPNLRVAYLEAAIGWVRWYADRLDEAAEISDRAGEANLQFQPSQYVYGGNLFFSCEPDEPGLLENVCSLGEEIVVFASDYPHFDCSFPETGNIITKSLSQAAVLKKVTIDNGWHLYGDVLK
jgi:predicted TIM-barrel fold metal-dependent hydrolase